MFGLRTTATHISFSALLPYCPTALLPYCPTALLPYCPTALIKPPRHPTVRGSCELPRRGWWADRT
ncbi:hypothetical protein F9L02_13915 [Brucella intermedia]|nr:hypothetical protein F9L02_13915 [Brucella intermedia]